MSEYIFKLPDLGEGTVEAEIAEWMVKVGDTVAEEDTICAMMTDKAAVELTAPVGGLVTSIAGEVGDMISVGTPLIIFATESDATTDRLRVSPGASPDPAKSAAAKPAAPADVIAAIHPGYEPTQPAGKVKTSPSIRQRAREAHVDLAQVSGSGPRGRIVPGDLEAFLARPVAFVEPAKAHVPEPAINSRAEGTTEIKVIGLRRKIAQRLAQANSEVPHFTYVEEVDVTALEALRRHLNSKKSGTDQALTFLPFIALALARILRAFPQCNAHYDPDRNVLIQHHALHLGVATQTKNGLKVPVVRHAEALSLEDVSSEIRRVTAAARDNSASREELSGSTITLTSLGKLGGVVSTPIINLPEVAIIGVNKAVERPVVENSQVVIRLMMNLSSSFDHRFVDGYDAAAMIQGLRQLLEQPATIFMAD